MVDSNRIRPVLSQQDVSARGEGVKTQMLGVAPRSQESPALLVNAFGTEEPVGFLYYPSEQDYLDDVPYIESFMEKQFKKAAQDGTHFYTEYDESIEGHQYIKEKSYLVVMRIVGNNISFCSIATTFKEAESLKCTNKMCLPLQVLEDIPYIRRRDKKQILKEVERAIKERRSYEHC